MVGISKLYCGTVEASDPLRYGRLSGDLPSHLLQFSIDKKPVVVWNVTSRCNLKCVHCYAAVDRPQKEISTTEGINLIRELKEFGVPVILFSGGEPTMREDLPILIEEASTQGIRAVISTNGTLISRDMAQRFGDMGLSYVGVSLDGLQATNDRFRGVPGAFEKAMEG
ncbi:MAG: radical SAM protein, partial [Thermodesulfobacteriota bacterium]|nr:radical SAM protein [Thermodesulfobacteriota bacterium]